MLKLSNVIFDALSNVVIFQLMPFWDAHELWTKLQDKYGVSKFCVDDFSSSTSSRVVFSTSSTSPTYGLPQGKDMANSVGHCNDDSGLIDVDPSSLSYCNAPSLDFDTSSIVHVSHACVDSPCISCTNFLTKSDRKSVV